MPYTDKSPASSRSSASFLRTPLRYSLASRLRYNGCPLELISEVLGRAQLGERTRRLQWSGRWEQQPRLVGVCTPTKAVPVGYTAA